MLSRRSAIGRLATILPSAALGPHCLTAATCVPGPQTEVRSHLGKPTLFLDGKPYLKPVFETYVPAAKVLVRVPGAAWRRPDGQTVHAVWNVWGRWQTPRMTSVRLRGTLKAVRNYLGQGIALPVDEQGRTLLPLDWGAPLYLIGPDNIEVR